MRVPKSGRLVRPSKAKTSQATLYPWGKRPIHAWTYTKPAKPASSPVRARLKEKASEQYPLGKALARIRYFETQRGLKPSITSNVSAESARLERSQIRPNVTQQRRDSVKTTSYARAAKSRSKLIPAFPATANLPVWRELGPTLIPHGQTYGSGPGAMPAVSGRCVGIVIDPADTRHLILCSAGGGLWGSGDGGATWNPLTDDQPSLVMGAIAHAPSSPNIMYAATGEGDGQVPLGVGLLRSSDAGHTWSHLPSAVLSGEAIYDIAVHPTNPLELWIAGTRGLYMSQDGGSSVSAVLSEMSWDVSINHNDPLEILVTTIRGLRLSSDGGSSFTSVALPGVGGAARFTRAEVCHALSNPNVAYVAAVIEKEPILWRRSSKAGNFKKESTPANMDCSQGWYDWCLAVVPDDPDIVFLGAIDLYRGVRKAGVFSWSNTSSKKSGDSIHPDQHHVAFDSANSNIVYACNDGGVFRSIDRGIHWESLNPGLGITEFEFLAHLESDAQWLIAGTQDNGTISNAQSRHWDQIALGDGGDCGTIDGVNAVCFHSYYGMDIERAPAKGANAFAWEDVSPPAPALDDDYPALFYPPMDVRDGVLCKAGASLFVSDDEGINWVELSLPSGGSAHRASALAIFDHTTLALGTESGKIYVVSKSASTWDNANVSQLAKPRSSGFVSDIVRIDDQGPTLWVSYSTIGGGHVFSSKDNGLTWRDCSGNLPNIPVNAIVVDPAAPLVVYAATDHGVYRTMDGGANWQDFSNGLPNVIVGDLILHETNRLLRAGTRNRGAWEISI